VPLDPTKRAITSLRASASSFTVGCGDGWTPRAGGEILFADIPTPCEIPGYGFVGAARFSPPPVWGEITGPYGTMRRTMVTGAATELLFYNHPGTNNIELGFNLDSGAPLAAGTTVTLEELLEVTPPAGGYLTRSQVLLPLVYQAVLGRAPDASGAATFGPIVASGAAGMESAASSMYGSAEFAARRASLSAEEVVHQFYVGLLGRRADPAGLAGKVPLVQSGQYAALFHALVTSNEFRIAFPLAYAP
jgi:hypothetical protein